MHIAEVSNLAEWRHNARRFILARVRPGEIIWTGAAQAALFDEPQAGHGAVDGAAFSVPAAFLTLAEAAACYDSPERWPLLYRILYRLVYEEKNLIEIDSDADIRSARLMEKAVNRDVHKFHAFVRFRRLECGEKEIYAAWHEPQHFTVERSAPFFKRRFGSMNFSIFTPKGCVHWDQKELLFSPAADKTSVPQGDEMEDLWLTYYRSIFNPFRLRVRAMKKELPVRHWPTLPEAALIRELVRDAAGSHDG